MGYETNKKYAAREIQEWVITPKETREPWVNLQKKFLLKYGFGESMTNKIRHTLEAEPTNE